MLDSESEVAYVLAHEIAHVELRQAYLRIRDKHVQRSWLRRRPRRKR